MSRGETSDTLLIRNYEFWNVFDPKRDYVATHTFDLGKSGKVSELVYLKGTATPTTVTLSRTPSNQGNAPLAPGATVLVRVVDGQGQPVEEGKIKVSVEYQDNPQYSFAYTVDLSALLPGGLLPLDPPSSDIRATVSIQVVTPAGETTDTLVITGGFWEAVVATNLEYIAVHEFDFAKSGTTSSVAYIPGPQP